MTVDELATEIMRHWQANLEAGTVCQFCSASVAYAVQPELMPHDPDCIVLEILTTLVIRNFSQ